MKEAGDYPLAIASDRGSGLCVLGVVVLRESTWLSCLVQRIWPVARSKASTACVSAVSSAVVKKMASPTTTGEECPRLGSGADQRMFALSPNLVGSWQPGAVWPLRSGPRHQGQSLAQSSFGKSAASTGWPGVSAQVGVQAAATAPAARTPVKVRRLTRVFIVG